MNAKEYFENPYFSQMLECLKEKYCTYGKCTGVLSLKPSTVAEADKLSSFLTKRIKANVENKVKIAWIQKSLDDSRFEGMTVEDLVWLFYPNIRSNKDIREERETCITKGIQQYMIQYQNSPIQGLFTNEIVMQKMKYLVIQEPQLLESLLKALNALPIFENKVVELAIFATHITGNPHYFDLDTKASNQLLKWISQLFSCEYQNDRKTKISLLEASGILIDSVSNFVITYNLKGNEMLDSFLKQHTPLTLTLANLYKMECIVAKNDTLFIVENPSFLSKIMHLDFPYAVLITSGNSNYVIYKLLEKISAKEIYFNGDFDPEGLLIAQNLKQRFPQIKLLGYDLKHYQNGISHNEIAQSRLKKLDKITEPSLYTVKQLLLQKKLASYQEANYEMLLDFLLHDKNGEVKEL